jgi:hypothetical protein
MERDDCNWHVGDTALNVLKLTMQESMERGFIYKGNVEVASMAVWGMVHGLVSLAIRERFNKLVPENEIRGMMHQSLNWFLGAVDQAGRI